MYHIWSSYIIITASANIFEKNFRGIIAHIFAYGPTDFVGNDFAPVVRDVYLKRTMPMLEAIAVDKTALASVCIGNCPTVKGYIARAEVTVYFKRLRLPAHG